MRSALRCVVAALAFVGCADAALHAASGRPRAGQPRSVERVELVFRSADSVSICASMNAVRGPWPILTDPVAPHFAVIAAPPRAGGVIAYEDWKVGWCPPAPEGTTFPVGEVLSPQNVAAENVRLGDQQIVLSEDGAAVATLALGESEATGNPLLWPLVPVAYSADAVGLGAGAVVYGAAVVAAAASYAAVGGLVLAVWGPVWVGHKALGLEPGGAAPPDPPPPPAAPPDPPPAGGSP